MTLQQKKKLSHQPEQRGSSALMLAQRPCASLSPQRAESPVLFTRKDQHPSSAASGMITFGGSNDELDSMSLATSESSEWVNSGDDSAPPPLKATDDVRPRVDSKLMRVLTKAVQEHGLDWSAPEEPTRSRLDEWFLQRDLNSGAPLASSLVLPGNGATKKGYVKVSPLEEAVAVHLCPPTATGWKMKAIHPSKPCSTQHSHPERSLLMARLSQCYIQWRYFKCIRPNSSMLWSLVWCWSGTEVITGYAPLPAKENQLIHCLQSYQDGPADSAATQGILSTRPSPAESGA
ncbi:hypothetical protein DPX16_8307 [Anabarilius grahami]|uniref:Uncharacterized protein n=1 Tax=Anabarilius grahami TaxID=495550 RepID=A0A3N0YH97_ANAGA|nr:hypothetical protein DPX16_8307 [Anabarilius grahami]